MNTLERYHLKRLCDKWEIDYQEIDDTLTYWENKKHILTIVLKMVHPLDFLVERKWESLEEQYMKEHFLTYYVCCIQDGLTVSKEMGAPLGWQRFSLRAYIEANRFFGVEDE